MNAYRHDVPTLLLYTASWVPYDRPMRVIFEETVVDLHRLIPDATFDAWCINLDILTEPPIGPRRTAATTTDADIQHILPGGAPEHRLDFTDLSEEITYAIQRALGYGGITPSDLASHDMQQHPWEEVGAFIPKLEWLPTLLLVYEGEEYARFAGLVPKLDIRAELLAHLSELAPPFGRRLQRE
ncbi:hypothetical protein DDD64_06100 [Actinotignum sanguinis]|uniref:hypothetical protein n=1 Tax=Actinotignum TaxID=1653174 RepID=UPI000F7F0717|nr:hypothetical protein [Actinotignum sanguinis]MDY5148137.1 hypothetical protein [Actinotignum sanguinis]RTE48928.1 hypothetical protein DDD64_06100 [Actinotignum sanguinis]